MSIVARIMEAKQAHEALRAGPATSRNLAEKAVLYKPLKAILDDLWLVTDRSARQNSSAKSLRSAVQHLVIDAEYFAGLNDAEGFRDPADVWKQYELLERALAGSAGTDVRTNENLKKQ